ncbi:hypothetical protein RHMOL_Rhmol04G0192400 [Rhododendron molle]|uniref:Uncharacterized protein n=1 Tax=Rhododendron molle TaxID=49168 RepID=A0ACC0P4C4_RHOML|nr:hypothetical protein RHMOL_Rhmol04G0192400 [Rhododendron molle]
MSRDDSLPSPPSSPSSPSSPEPVQVKTEALLMADVPPPNLANVLADIQRNMAIMQQRADQADTSMATLRALIEERLPPVGGAGGGGEGREHEERVGTDTDVDEKYLSYYTEGDIIPDTRRQLGAILPLIDSISDVTHLCTDLGGDPNVNIVPVE